MLASCIWIGTARFITGMTEQVVCICMHIYACVKRENLNGHGHCGSYSPGNNVDHNQLDNPLPFRIVRSNIVISILIGV